MYSVFVANNRIQWLLKVCPHLQKTFMDTLYVSCKTFCNFVSARMRHGCLREMYNTWKLRYILCKYAVEIFYDKYWNTMYPWMIVSRYVVSIFYQDSTRGVISDASEFPRVMFRRGHLSSRVPLIAQLRPVIICFATACHCCHRHCIFQWTDVQPRWLLIIQLASALRATFLVDVLLNL